MNFLELLEKSQIVNLDEILTKICVSRPYFGFDEIREADGVLFGKFKPEQTHAEGTQLALAESMRHLAILGTCAYSMTQKVKNYYLVIDAKGSTNKASEPLNNDYTIAVYVQSASGNNFVAKGFLLNEKMKIIHSSIVEYKIFKEPIFKRLFKHAFLEYKKPAKNPYESNFEMSVEVFGDNCIEATLGKITPEHCAGHFDNHPIVPLAYLSHHSAQLVAKIVENPIFKSFEGKFFYCPLPNMPVKITVGKVGDTFHCESSQDGQICNNLILKI